MKRILNIIIILTLICFLFLFDFRQQPNKQITSKILIGCIALYQRYISPLTSHFIKCRYSPTCSVYTVKILENEGISGLPNIVRRILSCR